LTNEIINDAGVSKTIGYTYDDVGNRLTKTDAAAVTRSTYNDNDQLEMETTGGVTTTYRYDFNGNTVSKVAPGATTTYAWDQEDRMVGSILPDGRNLTYRYDDDGIRVSSSVNGISTNFLVDKNQPYAQVLEEYTGNTLSRIYTYGDDLISQAIPGGAVSFYHYDGQMSTRRLTAGSGSNSGNTTDTYTYDAFGVLLASTGSTPNNYLYTGEQLDANVGSYYLRARYYNQDAGRFFGIDPLQRNRQANLYLYTGDDPLDRIDPSGEDAFAIESLAMLTLMTAVVTTPVSAAGYSYAGPKGTVVWTFDDGPDGYTLQIANILESFGVKGAFFINGDNLKQRASELKDVVKKGHTIGNHTWDHEAWAGMTTDQRKESIRRLHNEVEKSVGYTMQYWRGPGGATFGLRPP
jgi:RHS repeat-associated protein